MFHEKHESQKYVLPLKNWVDWINTRQENIKNAHFETKRPKIEKYIFPLLTNFYNVTLKTETSWAKKFVKSILKTWNVNDIIIYVWFIYFWIKKN